MAIWKRENAPPTPEPEPEPEGQFQTCQEGSLRRCPTLISILAEEGAEGDAGEGEEAGEGGEDAECLPEGYPVDEEAAEGMKVEVRTNSLTP